MGQYLKYFYTAFIFLTLNLGNVSAQYTEAGIGIGTATYWGDLSLPTNFANMSHNSNGAIQLVARYIKHPMFGWSASVGFSKLSGDDAYSTDAMQRLRNLSFSTPLLEIRFMGEFYPFEFGKPMGDLPFYPYLTAGISGFYFNPSTIYQGQRVYLQPLGTEGQGLPGYPDKYSKVSFAIPFGGGMKWAMNEDWSLNVSCTMSRSFTDYLDDVSETYADRDQLASIHGPLAANLSNRMQEYLGTSEPVIVPAGSQRGGKLVPDYFMHIMISLQMRITDMQGRMMAGRGKSVKCPEF